MPIQHVSSSAAIESRCSVRTAFLKESLSPDDLAFLVGDESNSIHYLPADSDAGRSISAQTIEANLLQTYREPAQKELSDWIRFSSAEAREHRDGLTTGGMQIQGFSGWAVRNFYNKQSVMKHDFREQGLTKVRQALEAIAGWILVTSSDTSVASLLEAGGRCQRMWLKVRERNIGIHPLTQILEEPSTRAAFNANLGKWGIAGPVQFILRAGYVPEYPPPVSLRRPVAWFVRSQRPLTPSASSGG